MNIATLRQGASFVCEDKNKTEEQTSSSPAMSSSSPRRGRDFELNRDSNGSEDAFVECDLLCPQELHDLDSDYPMAPELLEAAARSMA